MAVAAGGLVPNEVTASVRATARFSRCGEQRVQLFCHPSLARRCARRFAQQRLEAGTQSDDPLGVIHAVAVRPCSPQVPHGSSNAATSLALGYLPVYGRQQTLVQIDGPGSSSRRLDPVDGPLLGVAVGHRGRRPPVIAVQRPADDGHAPVHQRHHPHSGHLTENAHPGMDDCRVDLVGVQRRERDSSVEGGAFCGCGAAVPVSAGGHSDRGPGQTARCPVRGAFHDQVQHPKRPHTQLVTPGDAVHALSGRPRDVRPMLWPSAQGMLGGRSDQPTARLERPTCDEARPDHQHRRPSRRQRPARRIVPHEPAGRFGPSHRINHLGDVRPVGLLRGRVGPLLIPRAAAVLVGSAEHGAHTLGVQTYPPMPLDARSPRRWAALQTICRTGTRSSLQPVASLVRGSSNTPVSVVGHPGRHRSSAVVPHMDGGR